MPQIPTTTETMLATSTAWPGMERGTIVAAMDSATMALAEVMRQLEQLHGLQHRASQLEAFLASARVLLEQPPASGAPRSPLGLRRTAPRGKAHTVAEHARVVLESGGRPMRLKAMAEAVREQGLMEGRFVEEGLRSAIRDHPDFERVQRGIYALSAWPPAQKRVP